MSTNHVGSCYPLYYSSYNHLVFLSFFSLVTLVRQKKKTHSVSCYRDSVKHKVLCLEEFPVESIALQLYAFLIVTKALKLETNSKNAK